MAVLNSARVIDACGNTAANPYAKTCTVVTPKHVWTETDTVVLYLFGGAVLTLVIALAVIGVAIFRRK